MAGGQKKGLPTKTKTIHTIDEKHSELIEYYNKIENETIPKLQKEKDELKQIIRTLKEDNIDKYMSIKDKIKEITEKVKKLKHEKKRYFLDNSKFIFDYFEQKQQISSNIETTTGSTNALKSFFKIKS